MGKELYQIPLALGTIILTQRDLGNTPYLDLTPVHPPPSPSPGVSFTLDRECQSTTIGVSPRMIAEIIRTYYVVDWNAVGAIATTAAVIVALFQAPARRWWNSPKLNISWRQRDLIRENFDNGSRTDIRLLIENYGREAARFVQVSATDLFSQSPSGDFELVPYFLPAILRWTYSGIDRSTSGGAIRTENEFKPASAVVNTCGPIVSSKMRLVGLQLIELDTIRIAYLPISNVVG